MKKNTRYIEDSWPKNKQDEVYIVKKFLDNQNTDYDFSRYNFDCNAGEPTDIFVKSLNKKFQIVLADFELLKLIGSTKPDNMGVKMIKIPPRKIEDVYREIIYKPIIKKSKYGKAARGITLLIYAGFNPPWIEEIVTALKNSTVDKKLKKLEFDEIFLVLPEKNYLLYS